MFSSTYKEPHPRGIRNENPMQNPGFSARSQISWDSLVYSVPLKTHLH